MSLSFVIVAVSNIILKQTVTQCLWYSLILLIITLKVKKNNEHINWKHLKVNLLYFYCKTDEMGLFEKNINNSK